MKKRRSPQEKKSFSYKKDHYVSAGESRHAFRNHWPKKKATSNQVHRHRAVEALQSIESLGNLESIENAPIEVTAEQLRKRDPRNKLDKFGVRSLKDHLQQNQKNRERRAERTREMHTRIDREFLSAIITLERNVSSARAADSLKQLVRRGSWELRNFLRRNPTFKARIKRLVDELNRLLQKSNTRQEYKEAEKERTRRLLESIQRQAASH